VKRKWLLLVVLLVPLTSRAADKPETKVSLADRLAEIQKEHATAQDDYYKTARALRDTAEGNKKAQESYTKFDKKQAELFMAAVEVAMTEPKSDTATKALEWVLTIPRSYYHPAGKLAMQLAAEHHATSPKGGKIIAFLGRFTPPEKSHPEEHEAAMAFIQAVIAKNPDRTTRGQAVMAVASQAKRKFSEAEYRKSKDVDELAAGAEKAFEAVVKDYGDCPYSARKDAVTLGELAKRELFELRFLRIGKVAPQIEGEDLDGVKFKLSDYRGKVVVIDFWGDW
jgi:hypothetical protein